jgi:hypothetical protein
MPVTHTPNYSHNPSKQTFWRRAVPWIVVYGLLLAILFFALA